MKKLLIALVVIVFSNSYMHAHIMARLYHTIKTATQKLISKPQAATEGAKITACIQAYRKAQPFFATADLEQLKQQLHETKIRLQTIPSYSSLIGNIPHVCIELLASYHITRLGLPGVLVLPTTRFVLDNIQERHAANQAYKKARKNLDNHLNAC